MNRLLLIAILLLITSCATKPPAQKVDLIIYNANIYTVDSAFANASAFAVKDGKFVGVGTTDFIRESYNAKEELDLHGKTILPGLIDAHCHFYGYGLTLTKVNLLGTTSWDDVVQRTHQFYHGKDVEWITGRGWDQTKWPEKKFPTKEKLDEVFPDKPVMLRRVDGHAAIVNSRALELAGITAQTKVAGGEVIVENGQPTGLLIDNAVELVKKVVPPPSEAEQREALITAQKNCFAVGLTTVDDAGLPKQVVDLIKTLQAKDELKMRIYVMLDPDKETMSYYMERGPEKTDRLNVRAFKFYGDGALGSRGAALLQPYTDRPGSTGLFIHDTSYYRENYRKCNEKGFQACTHAIGDAANQLVLDLYAEQLSPGNDKRWRVEHVQVVAPNDFSRFGRYNIIPSIQPTHATSDMYWAEDRLGPERIKGAYAYKKLHKEVGMVANGSDFPVEDINPFYGFYAAVVRKDQKGWPEEGFQTEDALSREEALKAMTIWAAYSNFEEHEKGSIEPGKFADFVVLDNNPMTAPADSLYQLKVLQTFLAGEKVFER